MHIQTASTQWASRPADERFRSISDLHNYVSKMRDEAEVREVPWRSLRVAAGDGGIALEHAAMPPAAMTHYAFGQLCGRVGAPAAYLRKLPATLACQNLNHNLSRYREDKDEDRVASILYRETNGALTARAALTPVYSRIWNADVTERLLQLEDKGWRVPPARPARGDSPTARIATEADVLHNNNGIGGGLAVKVGDMIDDAGIYGSDRDIWVFMVKEGAGIDDGSGNPTNRGFFAWNSEVGDKVLGISTFLYQAVCGNHIVWDATDLTTVKIRHVGDAAENKAWFELTRQLDDYSEASALATEQKIKRARGTIVAADKDELLDKLFGLRSLQLSRANIADAYDEAVKSYDEHKANPLSFWGMVEGITRVSRSREYAENRVRLDRAAGRLMALVK